MARMPLIRGAVLLMLAAAACPWWSDDPSLRAQGGAAPVAPETFNGSVYRGSFSADGNTLYFFRAVGDNEQYRIFVSARSGSGWSVPERIDLGGDFSDLYPSISRDGSRLVFSSYRPVPGYSGKPNAHLWYVDRVNGRWGPPVFMRAVNTPGHYHSWAEFGPDDVVYFRRTTPDWTVNETRRARWTGTEYGPSELYHEVERWKQWRPDVRVVGGAPGPSGSLVMLDVATRHPVTGRQASDIWFSERRGTDWTEPRPLGAGVNSAGFDVFPFVSRDGRTLYFVRDFNSLWQVSLADATASSPPDGTGVPR